ncbi:ApeA N-terminal domain 1-containing protein [Agromyces bracchium]|uniref:ApeA N-terminal domain-containing protein n=1 Tax=Agromyces bracchium TaxID=88376 RepID=A0A6I3M8B4_9MICO|nr:hypothetical protein [Agromyces bracchium]MTH68357.1 hypothetical protein [Agromyces bracchium]
MTINKFDFGDSFAGLLIDGVEETPYVGATLRLTDTGVEIEVPYLSGYAAAQFAHVDEWFRQRTPPTNMLLRTREGAATLFGCRWRGHSSAAGSRIGSGRIAPDETLLHDREESLSEPLTVKSCRSRADGLNHWTRLTAVESDAHRDDERRTNVLEVTVKSPEPIEWQQGEATMRIQTSWRFEAKQDGYERIHELHDNVLLESEWVDPREFFHHLAEHRKVMHLLVFLFGTALSFREHQVRDETIASRTMDGTLIEHPFVELISARTIRERGQPTPAKEKLGRPLLVLQEVGAEGLTSWAEMYGEWERFILPAVAVIGRRNRFIEDVVMSTSMALEAAGQLIGERPGEEATYGRARPSMATYVFRCLDYLDIGWDDYIHSQVGLARAISNNYKRVKHADNGAFPDHVETALIGEVNELVVRLLAASLTGAADELLQRYRSGSELWQLQQLFEANEVRIDDDAGTWVSTVQADAQDLTD